MGNKVKGKIDFTVAGDNYTLHFTTNALCELESACGSSAMKFINGLDQKAKDGDLPLSDVRLLFWAGLQEHHPNTTVQKAGSLIHDMGGLDKAMEMVGEAVGAAFPQADDGDGAAAEGNAAGAS